MSIQQILKNTSYHLDLFSESETAEFEKTIMTRQANGKTTFYVRCLIRDRDIKLKPEEVVRQLYLRRLLKVYGYPKNRIAVEFSVAFGSEKKFADIVILDKDHPTSAYIIVELKSRNGKKAKINSNPTATRQALPSVCGQTAGRFPITIAKTPTTSKTSQTFQNRSKRLPTSSVNGSQSLT